MCLLYNREYEFQAAMHGATLTDKEEEITPDNTVNEARNVPMFGDPDDFKDLDPEEQQRLTDKMAGKHQSWVNTQKV